MNKLLVIIRHGDYGDGYGDDPLSKFGLEQMQKLSKAIYAFITEKAKVGQEKISSLFFSFSNLKRAVQSAQELRWSSGDIIVTGLGDTKRENITNPQGILEKVMGLGNYYGANVIAIIAHGDMPAVIAETAHEFVTGKKLDENLCMPGKGRGYIADMVTGEITPIGWDSLDEKKPPKPVARLIPDSVLPKVRPAEGPPPRDAGPYPDPDDDIPF